MDSERVLKINWEQIISGAFKFPDIEQKEISIMDDAKRFVNEGILGQRLSAEYILSLTDAVFSKAHEIANCEPSNPLVEIAVQEIDDDAWDKVLSKFMRCKQSIDPSVEGEFI